MKPYHLRFLSFSILFIICLKGFILPFPYIFEDYIIYNLQITYYILKNPYFHHYLRVDSRWSRVVWMTVNYITVHMPILHRCASDGTSEGTIITRCSAFHGRLFGSLRSSRRGPQGDDLSLRTCIFYWQSIWYVILNYFYYILSTFTLIILFLSCLLFIH